MKDYITITGFGNRMAGVSSKTNKPFDFIPISFLYDAPFHTGKKAATVNVDAKTLGDFVPTVGVDVLAVFHEDYRSRKVYIDAFL